MTFQASSAPANTATFIGPLSTSPPALGGIIGDVTAPYALIIPRGISSAIASIVPDVVVEETHHDELVITDHPVETGAAISDHAFLMPVSVQMKIGFSDSSAQQVGYINDVYLAFQKLQQSRQPFDVVTHKRLYQNMLIQAMSAITDQHNINVLQMVVDLREVIIVSTSTAGGSPNSAQALPQKTGNVVDAGNLSLAPAGPIAANPATDGPGFVIGGA